MSACVNVGVEVVQFLFFMLLSFDQCAKRMLYICLVYAGCVDNAMTLCIQCIQGVNITGGYRVFKFLKCNILQCVGLRAVVFQCLLILHVM